MAAKILFLGFDGADPAFIDRMIADGELPAFKRARDGAETHAIENDPGMGAAQFWNSASIGAGPGWHGHYFYMQFKPDTYDIIPNHESTLPDITPFWNRLDAEGFRIAVIDWHRMMPKPMANGAIIDNWLNHDPLTQARWLPPSLAAEAERYFKSDPIGGGFAVVPRETPEALNDYLFHLFNRAGAKVGFCAEQLREKEWDLFIACFGEAHDVGHYLYEIDDERHERHDRDIAAEVKTPLRETYRRLDAAVAKLIEAAGPDARVFVFGGPGMEPLISANLALDEMMRRIDLGAGAPLSAAETAKRSYHRFMPQRLRWALAPLARAVRRRVARKDFARRRFFAVPHNDNAGAIRINLKGREKYGAVAPGADYGGVVEEIREALATFVNPDTGRKLVKRVVCVRDEFDGPYRDVLPDLFVEWDRAGTPQNFRKAVSKKFGEIGIEPTLRTGDHNPTGFFWGPKGAAGKSVLRPGDIAAPVMKAVRALTPAGTRAPQLREAL